MVDYARASQTIYEVSEDIDSATKQLVNLYRSNQTEIISTAYERFKAILGEEHPAMIYCWMAELTLQVPIKFSTIIVLNWVF